MNPPLITQAIVYALSQNWKAAIKLNLQIISEEGISIDTLNRLAFAYLKSGKLNSAKTAYKKVLRLDRYNPIALKNLNWLKKLTKKDIHGDGSVFSTPTVFLEEPGQTKITFLVHLAPARTLCNLLTAQKVQLIPKAHHIEIRDYRGVYIGALPDDLTHRLKRLMERGNQYVTYIKNVTKNNVSVFIREVKRCKKYSHLPSFPVCYTNRSKEEIKISQSVSI